MPRFEGMGIFVIERDLPIALLIDAQREFDRLSSTAIAAETDSLAVVAGLYLAGVGRSISIVRAPDEARVRALLSSAGLRHAVVHHAVYFPTLSLSPGPRTHSPAEPPSPRPRGHR